MRKLRLSFKKWLERKLTTEVLQQIAEDQTGVAFSQDDDLAIALGAFARGELGEDLDDIFSTVLKCESDLWAGHLVYGGPITLQALVAELGMDTIPILTLHQFSGDLPEEQEAVLVHHKDHFIPAWAPGLGERSWCRPWLPEESYKHFSQEVEEAAGQKGWHCDPTTRAAGDCLYHGLLVLQSILAKNTVTESDEVVAIEDGEA